MDEEGEAEDDDWQAEEDEQLVRIPLVEEDENVKRDFIKALVEDVSLKILKEKAVKKVDGYRWMRGLLKRLVTDEWGRTRELLVNPHGFRNKLLRLAHDKCGHLCSKKTLQRLARTVEWPKL